MNPKLEELLSYDPEKEARREERCELLAALRWRVLEPLKNAVMALTWCTAAVLCGAGLLCCWEHNEKDIQEIFATQTSHE